MLLLLDPLQFFHGPGHLCLVSLVVIEEAVVVLLARVELLVHGTLHLGKSLLLFCSELTLGDVILGLAGLAIAETCCDHGM